MKKDKKPTAEEIIKWQMKNALKDSKKMMKAIKNYKEGKEL